mmetsp:Transcript_19663/g.47666  ORF Transcript_19663/g.47666 Transcript_19663/m.47666 type:complete len:223 (-) Transcript_19663:166-834(-)
MLEHRQDTLHVRDLLVVHEHQRLCHLHHLCLGVGAEMGGDEPTVEAHALHDLQLVVEGLALADGDGAVLADALEGLGEHGSDLGVGVGGDGCDLLNFRLVLNRLGPLGQVLEHNLHSSINSALQIHRVHPSGDGLAPLHHDSTTKNGGGGGSVSGNIIGLRRDLLEQLSPQVLHLVLQVHRLGHGDPILGHLRRTKRLLDDHVPPLGAHGPRHRVGQHVAPR